MKPFEAWRRRDFLRIGLVSGLYFIIPGWRPQKAEAVLKIGNIPPTITLIDLNGGHFRVPEIFKGKVALIHFWASWCPSCRKEMATLESAYLKYSGKGLLPCSIDIGESKEAALRYIKNMKITYPVLLDPSSSTVKPFGISGIPTCYVLDRGNVVRFKILGEVNGDGLDKIVRTLL